MSGIHRSGIHRLASAMCLTAVFVVGCSENRVLEIDPDPIYLKRADEALRLHVMVREGKQTQPVDFAHVSFTSLTPQIVSVDPTGIVTAQRSGDGAILVRITPKLEKTVEARVQIAKRLVVEPASAVLGVGVRRSFSVTVFNDIDEPIIATGALRWSVSNPDVINVNDQGDVHTLNPGEATLSVRGAGISGEATVVVRSGGLLR